jgi:hypothetical protein
MVMLNFNAQQVAPNAALDVLPSGVYDVVITNSAEKPTSKSTPSEPQSFIEFEMTIRSPDPQLNNRKVFDRLNIKNKNQQAVDIAYATLSALCHVTGRYQIQDTQQLHGVPFKAVVAKVERNDRPGEFSNEVKGYKDAAGNDPGTPGVGQSGAGQQAPQPSQPPQYTNGAAPQPGYTPQPGYAPQPGYGQGPQGNGQVPQQAGYGNQPGQHSDQHQMNQPAGTQQGNGQGNGQQPPAWTGNGQQAPAPQQQAPQQAPQQAMPPQPPAGNEPPPWARPQ